MSICTLGCQPVQLAVMGDSTSLDDESFQGYANHLAADFGPSVRTAWPDENGRTSGRLLVQVLEWAPVQEPHLVLFNAGLHDIARRDGVGPQVPLEEYQGNLRAIAAEILALGATPVWRSTTPIPEDYPRPDLRRNDDVIAYNEAASELMAELGVLELDLYSIALPELEDWQIPQDFHFHPNGNEAMAREISAWLRQEFGLGLTEVAAEE